MTLLLDQSSVFYDAVTLCERIESLRSAPVSQSYAKAKSDLGRRRLKRWAAQAPFNTGNSFTRRLAVDGTNEDELACLLGEPPESIKNRLVSPPSWLSRLAEAFALPRSQPRLGVPRGLDKQSVAGFLKVVEPLINQALERTRAGVEAISCGRSHLPFDPGTVVSIFTPQLFRDLIIMLSRTMILELNVARLEGLLQGETAEQRFQSFLERLSKPDLAFALLREYPVLARQLVIRLDSWVDFTLDFLGDLCADWQEIASAFDLVGSLVEIEGGAGDLHHGGRAALIASFDADRRIVYEPRSLAIDAQFQELLLWINERGDHPPLRDLKLLDKQNHGWMEFVRHRDCASEEEVRRFYERQGCYIALLYAIEGVDFHHRNLIASGEHPMLIDMESLFHPRPKAIDPAFSIQAAADIIDRSVLKTGLLPRGPVFGGNNDPVDLPGLGAVEQLSPFDGVYWESAGTDQMHVARKRGRAPEGQRRSGNSGSKENPLEYREAIIDGFTKVYRTIVKHRQELLLEDGPLSRFAPVRARVVLRPTATYAELLSESFHPKLLRNALDRERIFDRLWIDVERQPHLAKVIADERGDLHVGDIPVFAARPDSRDLWTSSEERIENFFEESGLDTVRQRLSILGDEDLERQRWFIRASFTSLSTGSDRTSPAEARVPEAGDAVTRNELLQAARAVGDRLEALAIRGQNDASWIGVTPTGERAWSVAPLGIDLYGGVCGIALFLAYLGAVTAEERYTALAQSAIATAQHELARHKSYYKSIGAFSGLGGIIYAFTHVGIVLDRPSLLDEAQDLIRLIPSLIAEDEALDIIGGSAGCIAGLLNSYYCTHSAEALDIAVKCGDHLINKAVRLDAGLGWHTKTSKEAALTGFSHGAAGIAWALLRLTVATDKRRFRQTAEEAIAYERSVFSLEAGNWPDLRDAASTRSNTADTSPRYAASWCHGAPGIGLSRLSLLALIDGRRTRLELEAAINSTFAQGFGQNHSLCHGDLGNLELLLEAAELLDDPALWSEVQKVSSGVLHNILDQGWRCGVPMHVETPGLMLGLAGIGYGLMRMYDSARVPSVLMLAPPFLNKTCGNSRGLSNEDDNSMCVNTR